MNGLFIFSLKHFLQVDYDETNQHISTASVSRFLSDLENGVINNVMPAYLLFSVQKQSRTGFHILILSGLIVLIIILK